MTWKTLPAAVDRCIKRYESLQKSYFSTHSTASKAMQKQGTGALPQWPHELILKECSLLGGESLIKAGIDSEKIHFKAHALGVASLPLNAPETINAPAPPKPLSPEKLQREFSTYPCDHHACADAGSRRIFTGIIKCTRSGSGCLLVSFFRQYDHPAVGRRPGDVVYDAGAFNGNSTCKFLRTVGSLKALLACGLRPKAYADSLRHINGEENITLGSLGFWSQDADLPILRIAGGANVCRENIANGTVPAGSWAALRRKRPELPILSGTPHTIRRETTPHASAQ